MLDCDVCPPGYYCEGANTPLPTGPCLPGYYCTGGSTTSTQYKTPPGTYSNAGATAPINCTLGTYQPSWASPSCLQCPAGYYCNIIANANAPLPCTVVCPFFFPLSSSSSCVVSMCREIIVPSVLSIRHLAHLERLACRLSFRIRPVARHALLVSIVPLAVSKLLLVFVLLAIIAFLGRPLLHQLFFLSVKPAPQDPTALLVLLLLCHLALLVYMYIYVIFISRLLMFYFF